jgi:rhamnulokinase
MSIHLAIDLGADSGRAILGRLEGKRLSIEEIHRFPTGVLNIGNGLHWNIYRIFEEIKKALHLCARKSVPDSIGIDTWGVDFGLIDACGQLIGLPFSYRDRRTEGAAESFFKKIARYEVYKRTGIQFMEFNSLFQLESMVRDKSPILEIADGILFIPDILNYFLCGEKKTEFTFATTSQIFNPSLIDWDTVLISALGINPSLFQDIMQPGSILGILSPEISKETGIGEVPVIAVASHDTASAVAAVPSYGRDWAYISSGTWSLMGVETDSPVINDESFRSNFTSEGGVGGRWRVLKNISGMWLMQECRRVWGLKGSTPSYDELIREAESARAFTSLIDPDYRGFKTPADMPLAIEKYCRETGQPAPQTRGEIVRSILEGLALKYRCVLEQLCGLYDSEINRIHIIGGGSRNDLLNRFTAEAAGLPVIAGPMEATATGNLLMQAFALGQIGNLDELREIVTLSFETNKYDVSDSRNAWETAYERYREIIKRGLLNE